MRTCVLIPIHNEAQAIGEVVRAVSEQGFEAVVVDDGSTDGGGDIAWRAGAVVLRNAEKSGKGASLKKGFRHILDEGYDALITMDGDGQHDAHDLPKFIAAAEKNNAAMVNGNRMDSAVNMPRVRRLTNQFMSWLISRAAGQMIPDTQCGFRFIRCDVLRQMAFDSDDFEIETEMIMKAAKKGHYVASVPIKTIYEDEVSKIHPVKDTLRFIRYFLKEILSKEHGAGSKQ